VKTVALIALAAAQVFALPLMAQTFDRAGRIIVAPEERNVAAAQVAVAQSHLFGSMLVSYRMARPGVARVAVATRKELKVFEIDSENFEARLVQRVATTTALPKGTLVCRSYAPIDAILSAGKRHFPNAELEVLPPHRPGMAWRARIGSRLLAVSFDNKGVARFGHLSSR
jgi:hypothetical protein